MKRYIFILMLCFSIPSVTSAGWFKNFCNRYIIADDPNEAREILEELRMLYPSRVEFEQALYEIYRKQSANETLLRLIELELGI